MRRFLIAILPIVLACSTTVAFAQKVQEKKGILFIDKKEVAKIETAEKHQHVFTSLSGEPKFRVDYKYTTSPLVKKAYWLEFRTIDGKTVTHTELDEYEFTLNMKEAIARMLNIKYHILDENGFSDAKIEAFFAEKREDLTQKYTEMVRKAEEAAAHRQVNLTEAKNKYHPYCNTWDKKIYFASDAEKKHTWVEGSVTCIQVPESGKSLIDLYDLDGQKIASLYKEAVKSVVSMPADVVYFIYMYDGAKIKFPYGTNETVYKPYDKDMIDNMVLEVLASGYVLGKWTRVNGPVIINKKIKDNNIQTNNFYHQKGYMILEEGEKVEGTLTLVFDGVDFEKNGVISDYEMIGSGGQVVKLTKSNYEVTKYGAKGVQKVCKINEDGSETCYQSVSVKTESNLMKLARISQAENPIELAVLADAELNSDHYFLKLIHEGKKISIYESPSNSKTPIVKLHTEKKGIEVDSKGSMASVLDDYLGKAACKEVSAALKAKSYNLKDLNDLIKLANDVDSCK